MCRRGIAARAVLIARRIRRIQAEIRRGLYRVAIVAPLLSLLDRQRKQAVLLRRRAHRFTKTIEGASSAASCPIHATSRPSFVTSASMRRVALFDIDSRIPNLALMKLSAYYKTRGCEVVLARKPVRIETDKYFASTVFLRASSRKRIDALQALYGDRIEIGGSGIHLGKRHPAEAEASFPDYGLYSHRSYALGFLTRGCHRRCAFCVVPEKEGAVKQTAGSFDDFVPSGQKNVMLLDDNLLSFNGVDFSQTLDISWLTETIYERLLKVDYRNARFNRRRIYFSCNYPGTIALFMARRAMLKSFGHDAVSVVCIYGFDTHLSEDYARWMMLRRHQ